MHNFIAYVQEGGNFLKFYWGKRYRKQVSFFHVQTVKRVTVQDRHLQTAFVTDIFVTVSLIRLSKFLSYTNSESGKFQSFHMQTALQCNSQ